MELVAPPGVEEAVGDDPLISGCCSWIAGPSIGRQFVLRDLIKRAAMTRKTHDGKQNNREKLINENQKLFLLLWKQN